MAEVRTRFAPSPTGFLHIGSLRTALYEFLWARKNNGKYILRIEDTDQTRSVEGGLENIVKALADVNINADEGFYWNNGVKERGSYGPYLQSQRLETYKKYANELIEKKAAYYCFCTQERLAEVRKTQEAAKLPPKYDKHCLNLSAEEVASKLSNNHPHVIRLNVPAGEVISFKDELHGEISVPSKDLDDQVLVKSDGFPTYHLAVVVDDHLMEISHVIRADEWIPSTPKHVLLYKAFGWELPKFVHLPPILSKATRKKLSKREGDVSVESFLEKGYLPDAIINYLALMGWNPKTEEEIFSLVELEQQFSLEKLNKAGAYFDEDKLDWFNTQYIRKLKPEELFARILPYLTKAGIKTENYPKEFLVKILELERERLKKLSEIGERVKYFFEEPKYDPSLLVWKKSDKQTILKNLQSLQMFLQSNQASEPEIKKFIEENKLKTGEVLWPLRVALTGLDASPGPFEIMNTFNILPNGKEIILQRISKATERLYSA
jgi:nondiscriminating glutamyl-tRNA synthetase